MEQKGPTLLLMVKVAAGLVVTVWKPSRVFQAAEDVQRQLLLCSDDN
jgi:hypothetical protein